VQQDSVADADVQLQAAEQQIESLMAQLQAAKEAAAKAVAGEAVACEKLLALEREVALEADNTELQRRLNQSIADHGEDCYLLGVQMAEAAHTTEIEALREKLATVVETLSVPEHIVEASAATAATEEAATATPGRSPVETSGRQTSRGRRPCGRV